MGLTAAERLCLDLAWQAFGAGSVPVGAVVLCESGTVVSSGRSRMYETRAPTPEIANSILAHAEVNALVKLDPRRRYEHHTLVTTLEPCPLCAGALAMSTIGRLTFLGADPYGGAVGRLANTAHTARVPVQVSGPRRDAVGTLASCCTWPITCSATRAVPWSASTRSTARTSSRRGALSSSKAPGTRRVTRCCAPPCSTVC